MELVTVVTYNMKLKERTYTWRTGLRQGIKYKCVQKRVNRFSILC